MEVSINLDEIMSTASQPESNAKEIRRVIDLIEEAMIPMRDQKISRIEAEILHWSQIKNKLLTDLVELLFLAAELRETAWVNKLVSG